MQTICINYHVNAFWVVGISDKDFSYLYTDSGQGQRISTGRNKKHIDFQFCS